MSVRLITPTGFSTDTPYRHVATTAGSRHVFVAGQVGGLDTDISTDSLESQTHAALVNVAKALDSAEATFSDVVRLTFYVVSWRPEMMNELLAGVERARGQVGIPDPMPPASLIGVQALFEPAVLVEIEATAVVE